MKIGILADTHDKVEITKSAVATLKRMGAEVLFHCGDLMGEDILRVCAGIRPFYFVAGNNDPSSKRLQSWADTYAIQFLGEGAIVNLSPFRVGITHGHLKPVVRDLLAQAPDVLLVGHSHMRRDQKEGKTRIINPGALHRSAAKSCALLDLETGELTNVLMPVESLKPDKKPSR